VEFVRRVLDRFGRPKVGDRGASDPIRSIPPSTDGLTLKEQGNSHGIAAAVGGGYVELGARSAPLTVDAQPGFDSVLKLVNGSVRAVMILGGAGTGKTTFLHQLQRDKHRKQVFLAPTGVAALQLGGQTIHSFFAIPPRIVNHDEIQIRARQRKLIRNLDRIIIDEISMVRADLLDIVDRTLRIAREQDVPFGGVQVLMVGDFFQLPPVVTLAEEQVLTRLAYKGAFSFDSKVLQKTVVERVPFSRVYRQTDMRFVECLNQIRRGNNTSAALGVINSACFRSHRERKTPILLTPTNARADAYNHEGLIRLRLPDRSYIGVATGTFGSDNDRLPAPETLVLKIGARVMAVRNDPGKRWVNGSVGTVVSMAPERVTMKLDSGPEVEIERFTWEKIRYDWDEAKFRVAATVVGTYIQLPLVLAWALTIHKAQGLTLEDVRIDFDYGAFAPGQAYVAISRSRSLDGLSLVRPIRESEIKIDPRVTAYTSSFER
jgi:ATP-dependent DNA helicase PIF1